MTIHTPLSLRNRKAHADWLRRRADTHECVVFPDPRDSALRVKGIALRRRQRHAKVTAKIKAACDSARTTIERFIGQMRSRTTHILVMGQPLCCFSTDRPTDWPEGHYWVSSEAAADATCASCKRVHASRVRE